MWYLCAPYWVFLNVSFTIVDWLVYTSILNFYNKLISDTNLSVFSFSAYSSFCVQMCSQIFTKNEVVFFFSFPQNMFHNLTFLLCEFSTVVSLCSEVQNIMEDVIMTELSLCHSYECQNVPEHLVCIFSSIFLARKENLPHAFPFKRSDRMSFGFIFHRKVMLLYFFSTDT